MRPTGFKHSAETRRKISESHLRIKPIKDRFLGKVTGVNNPDGCWLWTANHTDCGYGLFALNGSHVMAHRFSYELLIGPIPAGLTLDHLCRNRLCVNPKHLEPISLRQNILRGNGFAAIQSRRTHCPHGHEYTPENTYIERGRHRKCRLCTLKRNRERYSKRKLEG